MEANDPQFGNTYAGWAEAMSIFAKYSHGLYGVEGHFDQVIAGPGLPSLLPEDEKARLKELGWRIDSENDCFVKGT